MSANEKTSARIVGVLFITAMVASLAGGMIIESVLTASDFLATVSSSESKVALGVLLELINGTAVIGIAVFMYPLFKKHNEALALGYVAFRIIEAAIIIAAVISPLTLIALSGEYLAAGTAEASNFQALGTSFVEVRSYLVGQLTGIFFSAAALLFYYLLYQTNLVPGFISVWGFISAALVLAWNLLELLGISVSIGIVLALPMILNELFLAVWLIVKGFNSHTVAAKQDPVLVQEV